MVTVGIDLAAQPKYTAACVVVWEEVVTVSAPRTGLTDDDLLRYIAQGDMTGIDVPLGWPQRFTAAIATHAARGRWPDEPIDEQITRRATDRFVRATVGMQPLSVATDRIAIPAMRAARVLSRLERPVERDGRDRIVEVYPAASLKTWGFVHRGYKGREGAGIRAALVDHFIEATAAWVAISAEARSAMVRDDNAFDALVAALTARAWMGGLARPIPDELQAAAATEGWIALPRPGSLATLATVPKPPLTERAEARTGISTPLRA